MLKPGVWSKKEEIRFDFPGELHRASRPVIGDFEVRFAKAVHIYTINVYKCKDWAVSDTCCRNSSNKCLGMLLKIINKS